MAATPTGYADLARERALQCSPSGICVRVATDPIYQFILDLRFAKNPFQVVFQPNDNATKALWDILEDRIEQSQQFQLLFDPLMSTASTTYSHGRRRLPFDVLLCAFRCFGCVRERDIPRFLEELQNSGVDGLSIQDHIQIELQAVACVAPELSSQALEILASQGIGKPLIQHFFFGAWHAGPQQRFHLRHRTSLLDVRAFLCNGFGRVCLTAVYNLFFALVIISKLQRRSLEFTFWIDVPMLAFLLGQIVEEARQLFVVPSYFRNFWNIIDVGTIMSLLTHYVAAGMNWKESARSSMAFTILFVMLRGLALLRNLQWLQIGANIRTAIAMQESIRGFLVLDVIVNLVFASTFFLLFNKSITEDAESQDATVNISNSTVLLRALRAIGVHHRTSGPTRKGSSPFESFGLTMLWLFRAGLGDFHFDAVTETQQPVAGTVLLVIYLLVASIILLNFMIAILSGIYDQHNCDSDRKFVIDMGEDSVYKSYLPKGGDLPWLPKPMNLVNMLLLIPTNILKFIIFVFANNRARRRCNRRIWQLQFSMELVSYWLFGNVVVVGSFVIFQILIVLPIVLIVMIAVSPASNVVFSINLLNGELFKIFHRSYSCGGGLMGRLQHCYWELTTIQLVCCSGPLIWITFMLVTVLSFMLSCFGMVPAAVLIRKWFGVQLPEVTTTWPVQELTVTLILLVVFGGICEVYKWVGCHGAEGPAWREGFDIVQKQANAEPLPAVPNSRKRCTKASSVIYEPQLNSQENYEALGLGDDALELPQCSSETGLASVASANTSQSKQVLNFQNMNTSMLLALLMDKDDVRPLIPQALDMIYRNDQVAIHRFSHFALYIRLVDFYRVACSLIRCAHCGKKTFALEPADKLRCLDAECHARLLRHPVLGLYCIEETDSGSPGMLFEDYFWAVWNSSLSRPIDVPQFLRHLMDHADAWIAELEENNNEDEAVYPVASLRHRGETMVPVVTEGL